MKNWNRWRCRELRRLLCIMVMGSAIFYIVSAKADEAADARAKAQKLIDQLEDADPGVRKTASAQLNSLPGDALEVVEAAAKREDVSPEFVTRLQKALKFIRPRARIERQDRQRRAWEMQKLTAAYEHGGIVRPQDAANVQAGLAAYDAYLNTNWSAREKAGAAAVQALQRAIDAGCTHPLINTLRWICRLKADADPNFAPAGESGSPLEQCIKADIPPIIKFYIESGRIAIMGARPRECRRAQKLFDDLCKDTTLPSWELEAAGLEFYLNAMGGNWDDREVIPTFLDHYQAAMPQSFMPYYLRGHREATVAQGLAQEARNVQELKECDAHLKAAEEFCAKAWELNPDDRRAASRMLVVKLQEGPERGGTPEQLELWFRRTITADPDNFLACQRKLDYLYQHGGDDHTAYLAFARECGESENYRAGIPNLLIDAHLRLANESGDAAEYMKQPQVWEDVQMVYENALSNFPANVELRSNCVKYAAQCGHWDVVKRQCAILGEHPALSVFKSMESYNYLRKKADRLAAGPATRPTAAP